MLVSGGIGVIRRLDILSLKLSRAVECSDVLFRHLCSGGKAKESGDGGDKRERDDDGGARD